MFLRRRQSRRDVVSSEPRGSAQSRQRSMTLVRSLTSRPSQFPLEAKSKRGLLRKGSKLWQETVSSYKELSLITSLQQWQMPKSGKKPKTKLARRPCATASSELGFLTSQKSPALLLMTFQITRDGFNAVCMRHEKQQAISCSLSQAVRRSNAIHK
jgi:hypothetical protein